MAGFDIKYEYCFDFALINLSSSDCLMISVQYNIFIFSIRMGLYITIFSILTISQDCEVRISELSAIGFLP